MSYTFQSRRRKSEIPAIWRMILCFQAAMTAWIGFTHGSGFELYLFRFAEWNYKSVYSLDHNIAGLIALLGLLVLWRAHGFFLFLLSALYFTETMLLSRFGGFVDNPYPLLGSAVHIVLPLAVMAIHKHRWAFKLLELAIFACLLSYAVYFLSGPAYFLDSLIQTALLFGKTLDESNVHLLLGTIGVLVFVSFFLPSKTALGPLIIGLFAVALTFDTARRFGFGYLPESLLKLTLLFGILLYWQVDPRRKSRGRYPSLGGMYA